MIDREHVLNCHACGDPNSSPRGASGRLCDRCYERHQRWLARIVHRDIKPENDAP